MPIYEYYCEHCDGIFEALRPMREAADPVPCPLCNKDGQRIMPTSFFAFTYREGYPRAIPDRGTYYHLGQEVRRPVTGPVRPNEHPDIKYESWESPPTKGDMQVQAEKKRLRLEELKRERDEGVGPIFTPEDQKMGIDKEFRKLEQAEQRSKE